MKNDTVKNFIITNPIIVITLLAGYVNLVGESYYQFYWKIICPLSVIPPQIDILPKIIGGLKTAPLYFITLGIIFMILYWFEQFALFLRKERRIVRITYLYIFIILTLIEIWGLYSLYQQQNIFAMAFLVATIIGQLLSFRVLLSNKILLNRDNFDSTTLTVILITLLLCSVVPAEYMGEYDGTQRIEYLKEQNINLQCSPSNIITYTTIKQN